MSPISTAHKNITLLTVTLILFIVNIPLGLCTNDVEVVEIVETVEVVQTADSLDNHEFSFLQIIGRLHPAMVHLPLGFLIAAIFMELFRNRFGSLTASKLLSLLSTLSFAPGIITGFLRAYELAEFEMNVSSISGHRNWMISSFIASIIATSCIFMLKQDSQKLRIASLFFLFISTILFFIGGHLGGQLVHGDDFLPF